MQQYVESRKKKGNYGIKEQRKTLFIFYVIKVFVCLNVCLCVCVSVENF